MWLRRGRWCLWRPLWWCRREVLDEWPRTWVEPSVFLMNFKVYHLLASGQVPSPAIYLARAKGPACLRTPPQTRRLGLRDFGGAVRVCWGLIPDPTIVAQTQG